MIFFLFTFAITFSIFCLPYIFLKILNSFATYGCCLPCSLLKIFLFLTLLSFYVIQFISFYIQSLMFVCMFIQKLEREKILLIKIFNTTITKIMADLESFRRKLDRSLSVSYVIIFLTGFYMLLIGKATQYLSVLESNFYFSIDQL